jgi:quercetin dioxygenase-like cupin family protein
MYTLEDLEKWKDRPEKTVYRYSVGGDRWVLIELRKGCTAGEHYHKGLLASKNPEVNIVLKGKMEYFLRDVNSGKTQRLVVEAPKIVKIEPYVYHELKALEESFFLEPFDEEAPKKDRFGPPK